MPGDDQEDEDDPLEAFRVRLGDEVSSIKIREGYDLPSQALTHWTIRQLSPRLAEKTIRSIVVSPLPGRKIDAVWFDRTLRDRQAKIEGNLVFLRSDGLDQAPGDAAANVVSDVISALDWIVSTEGMQESERAIQASLMDQGTTLGKDTPMRIIGAVPHEIPEGIQQKFNDFATARKQHVQYELFDLHHLYNLYLSRLETVDLVPPTSVTFRIADKPHPVQGIPLVAALVQVPLIELYKMVKENQLALFAKNLRVPIASARYNESIQRTIEDPNERKNFWLYNNGITAICTNFDIDAAMQVTASHLQIVNGCQTSMTVHNEALRWVREKRPMEAFSEASVLMRLIKLPFNDRERSELSLKIARFTNSQTPITGRDLRATDPEQAKFKESLTRDWRIFYESKKDEFKRRVEQNRAFRHNFDWPFSISNERAAQCFISFWLGEPAFAKTSKKKIFEDDKRYRSVFNLTIPAEAILAPTFVFLLLEDWRKKRGFIKRGGSEQAHRMSKNLVVRYGDYYLTAMMGRSALASFSASRLAEVDIGELRTTAKNLRLMNEKYSGNFQGTLKKGQREVFAAFDEALDLLTPYVGAKLEKDPEVSVRNLLVRESTWRDFYEESQAKVDGLLRSAWSYLRMNF